MKGVNKVFLLGVINGEVKVSSGEFKVVSMTVLTSETWKDKDSGADCEKKEYHRVIAFGKVSAQIIDEKMKNGDTVHIIGKLQTSKYKDKDGVDRYSTQVNINQIQRVSASEYIKKTTQECQEEFYGSSNLTPSKQAEQMAIEDFPF